MVQPILSSCCQALVNLSTGEEETSMFICSKCDEPCDQYVQPQATLTMSDSQPACPMCGVPIESTRQLGLHMDMRHRSQPANTLPRDEHGVSM